MSDKKCCVPGCAVNKGLNRTLHQFPNPVTDSVRFRTWISAIGGDILTFKNDYIYKYRRVCHAHFEERFCCRFNKISNIATPTLHMSGGATPSRESFCATCLSHDRKLFRVTDSKSLLLFLNLPNTDKLCWECNRFVLKMAAFRDQAARAQDILASMLCGILNAANISSLSRLSRTPVYQHNDITGDSPQINTIKTESIKEEYGNTFDECTIEDAGSTSDCHDSGEMSDVTLTLQLNKQKEEKSDDFFFNEARDDDPLLTVLSKQSEAKSDEIVFSEARDDDPLLTVLSKQSEAKSDEIVFSEARDDGPVLTVLSEQSGAMNRTVLSKQKVKGDEGSFGGVEDGDTGDIANASLKSLLSRKSSLINVTPFANKFKELEGVIGVPAEREVAVSNADKQPSSDCMYTETIMSEEEMLRWRERKKKIPVYAINNPALRCELCIEPFRNKILSTAHKRRHEEAYGACACRVCGLRSLSSRALRTHTERHHRLLTCKLCGYEWDSRNGMRQHGSVAHGIPIAVWDCDQCDRNYPTQEQLKRHSFAHRETACRVCGARVAAKAMQLHMQSHVGPVACAQCGRKCIGARSLAVHMRLHTAKVDEAAFCAECNMQFRTMLQYRSHLRYTLKHARTNDMPFKCDECDKSFLRRSSLVTHVESIHSAGKTYACDDCGQTFKSRRTKNYHVRRAHRVLQTRNHICDYCGKAFTSKPSLMDHINTHTGARPYKCALCDAAFGHSSALYLHGRFKHKIKKKSVAKETEGMSNTEKSASLIGLQAD